MDTPTTQLTAARADLATLKALDPVIGMRMRIAIYPLTGIPETKAAAQHALSELLNFERALAEEKEPEEIDGRRHEALASLDVLVCVAAGGGKQLSIPIVDINQ